MHELCDRKRYACMYVYLGATPGTVNSERASDLEDTHQQNKGCILTLKRRHSNRTKDAYSHSKEDTSIEQRIHTHT